MSDLVYRAKQAAIHGGIAGTLLPGTIALINELVEALEISNARLDEMSDYATEKLAQRDVMSLRIVRALHIAELNVPASRRLKMIVDALSLKDEAA